MSEAIEQDRQLSSEAYLADVARLDWAVHRAGFAADDDAPTRGLELLATTDPAQLHLHLRAGSTVVVSPHPIVEIWLAHHSPNRDGPHAVASAAATAGDGGRDPFDAARQALAEGRGQAAWVTRAGSCAVHVLCLDESGARFTLALLDGSSLDSAFARAGPEFSFEPWLILALRHQALAAVQDAQAPGLQQ